MKGFKFYALLGSITVATACAPSLALADEPAPPPATDAATERGVALDQLFNFFQNAPKDRANAGVHTSGTPSHTAAIKGDAIADKPHLAETIKAHAKAGGGKVKTQAAINTKTAAAKPSTTVAQAGHLHSKANSDAEVATYSHSSADESNVIPVSHSIISGDATQVIAASLDKVGNKPQYKAGEHMVISLKALHDCNVMVFDYDSNGTLTQLFPNDFDLDGKMQAGQNVELGGESSKYTLDISGAGTERIFVYAYPSTEGPITVAMLNPVPNTPFRSTTLTKAQYDMLLAKSRTYFDDSKSDHTDKERSVSVKGKSGAQPVALAQQGQSPNKIELLFQISNK